MTTTKIDKLKAQREELDKRIRELAAAQSKAEREADKRRKIILGGWVMKHRPNLVKEFLENGLIRDQDKAAFEGWTLPAPEPQEAANPAASADPAPVAKQA